MALVIKLTEQLGSDDPVQAYQANRQLTELVGLTGGSGARSLAATLAAELNATRDVKDGLRTRKENKHSPQARRQIAKFLALVGGDAEVAALKQATADLEIRDNARMALERIPTKGATDALIELAVGGVGPEFRIGAIGALGKRSGAEVAAALRQCLEDPSPEVRLAAADAISGHADPSADALIVAASQQPGRTGRMPDGRLPFTKARLRLAESLAKGGNKEAAKRICLAILNEKPDEAQQAAADALAKSLG